MCRLLAVIVIACSLLVACDGSILKIKSAQLAVRVNPAASVAKAQPPAAVMSNTVLQQQAYLALAEDKLLAACGNDSDRQLFEAAVCRQQHQRAIERLADVQQPVRKSIAVLNQRDDKRNPWQWLVASETCWSADCTQAQRLRTVVKRCGEALNLQAGCVAADVVW